MDSYLQLAVEILGQPQRVEVLHTLTVKDLIDEITIEFEEELANSHLQRPYYLWRSSDKEPLDDRQFLRDFTNNQLIFGSDPPRLRPFILSFEVLSNLHDTQLTLLQRAKIIDRQRQRDLTLTHSTLIIGRKGEAKEFRQWARFELDLDTDADPEYKKISREHCAIIYYADWFYLHPISTENGTYLNGRLVASENAMPLRSGDVIRLANVHPAEPVELQFVLLQD